MKISVSSLVFPITLGAVAFSQTIKIGAPADQTSFQAESSVVVEVDRPDSLTGSTEIALVIGLASCHNAPCLPPDEMGLGAVLYSGPYTPQIDDPRKPPRQNFTVVIPDFIAKGPAQLSVFHIALVGAATIPLSEFRNVTLNIL